MLPYGRTWNCRIARRKKGEEGKEEKEGERERERESGLAVEKDGGKEYYDGRSYVVCAWRGWRLPHEALRAELSYPYTHTYTCTRAAHKHTHTHTHTYTRARARAHLCTHAKRGLI